MQKMKKCVQSISGIGDHKDYDAFFLCVMSHGAAGIVYGVDGVGVDIKTDIVEPFYQGQVQSPMWEAKGLPVPGVPRR